MNLLVVESPTKAKTISKFLNSKKYQVASSMGHIRDLPVKEIGVDVAKGFEPTYVIPTDKKPTVAELKKKAAKADTVIFATDGDREGEAIAWHLIQALGLNETEKLKNLKTENNKTTQRIIFHEITKEAIQEALNQARQIDVNLVNAQQARRVLDRLVGYELSPFLWKAVARGLSAGRVQSAAVRLIVEKEAEIRKFKIDEYWTIEADFNKQGAKEVFAAKLEAIAGKKLNKLAISDKASADKILSDLEGASYKVSEVSKRETKKSPLPPFTTPTLQQAANRRLGFSAKQTMYLAQQLYEGVSLGDKGLVGLITYMRTDSVSLSDKFLNKAKNYLDDKLGAEYANHAPRVYKTKSKGAQEAHEAIRPTDVKLDPESVKPYLESRLFKLYQLIWQRAIASQMPEAISLATSITIGGKSKLEVYGFKATGSIIKFDGFLKVYPNDNKQEILPDVAQGDALDAHEVKGVQHFTQPPARYTDATLVKKLEELGIGRPSTYAPIISTIQDRRYVQRQEKNLKPTDMGEVVNGVLVKNFPEVVDYNFTAKVEEEFDEIAEGRREWRSVMSKFYKPFKEHLEATKKTVSKKDLEEKTEEKCNKCGQDMIIKVGRFGKFMACSGYPDCKNTRPVDNRDGEDNGEPEDLGKCPDCGKPLIRRRGRFGPFIGCSGYPDCKYIQKARLKETGIKCPKCTQGDIVEKKTRRGKLFFTCSRYPKCDQAYWNKPTNEKCSECQALVTETPKDQRKCENKECPTNQKKSKKESKSKDREDKEKEEKKISDD